jgi:hypothetical protein
MASRKSDNGIFISIGQGISIWGLMEGNLVHLFAKLMGSSIEKSGLVLYSIMNFHVWRTIISDLFAFHPDLKEFSSIWNKKAVRLRSLNDVRVRLAHHTALESGGPGDHTLKPGRNDTRPKSLAHTPLTPDDIDAFIEKLIELNNEMGFLMHDMERFLAAGKDAGQRQSDN